MIIQSERDPHLFAEVQDSTKGEGVRVSFWKGRVRTLVGDSDKYSQGDRRQQVLLGAEIIDKPFHVVLNKVYSLLNQTA